MNINERIGEERLGDGVTRLGELWSALGAILDHFRDGNWRARLWGLKSEVLGEFPCISKCLLVFCFMLFLAVSSLEFPTERFLATWASETLINERDAWWTERNDGVHSLGWEAQEEES